MGLSAQNHHGLFSNESVHSVSLWIISDEESVRSVSLWVVCDLDTVEGRDLMYNAIKQAVSCGFSSHLVFNSLYRVSRIVRLSGTTFVQCFFWYMKYVVHNSFWHCFK